VSGNGNKVLTSRGEQSHGGYTEGRLLYSPARDRRGAGKEIGGTLADVIDD
jgi:hypothetical protein